MSKKTIWILAAVVIIGFAFLWPQLGPKKEEVKKWPTQDISIVVPYPPGGGTDLTTRAIADEMAKALKANVSVVNMPGASGSVGTIAVWNKPHDGYTIAANGLLAFASYPVMGYTDKTQKDWHIWIATFSPNAIVAKGEGGKYKNMNDLLADLKNKPGQVTFGTAGVGTGGYMGSEVLKAGTKLAYKHVPYQGGAPAIVAGLSGEVDVVPQLLMEMVDHIRAGKMNALAVLMDQPFKLSGAADIPGISASVPAIKPYLPMGESFGIMVPKDTPPQVVKAIDDAFKIAVKSEVVKKFADQKGSVVLALSGEEAQAHVAKLSSIVSWTLFDGGSAKISPEKFGIPRLK
ncbi:MAG: tripartite tricarboxylate transporter substrate binding protein [Negativicutes bacterium]